MRWLTNTGWGLLVLGCALVARDVNARPVEDATAPAPSGPSVLRIGEVKLPLRHVPHGTFRAGSAATDRWHEADETEHEVTLSQDFDMLETPVTRGDYAAFVADTGYVTEAEKGSSGGSGWNGTELVQRKEYTWKNPGFTQTDDHPVVLVTYADALAFVSWVSAKTGRNARLPSEAEYEYATRAGTTTAWYVGDDESAALTIGVFKTGHGTEPVGKHVPNAWGFHDLSGNVYEWCSDVYAPYPTGAATDPKNETGPAGEPLRRVLRGGSWLKEPKRARSAARYRNTPGSRNADNGFRFVVVDGAPIAFPTSVPPLGATRPPPPALTGTPTSALGVRREDDEMGLGTLIALLVGVIAAASVGWWALSRKPSRPSSALPTPTFVVGTDGFRLRTLGLPPGSRVRYECVVNGVPVSDVVPVGDGPETFVYTGATPEAIRVLEVVAVTTDTRGRSKPRRVVREESPRRDDDDDRPFGGFPSAY